MTSIPIIPQSIKFKIDKLSFKVNKVFLGKHCTKSNTYNGIANTINIELNITVLNNGIFDLVGNVLVNS